MPPKRQTNNKIPEQKTSNITIFISHRNLDQINEEAERLQQRLQESQGYNCFFDKESLKAGDIWKTKIHESIRKSDVLILLIAKDGDSDWVKREVDIARGASVAILPIVLTDMKEEIAPVQAKLDLGDIQYMAYKDISANKYPQLFDAIIERIEYLTTETRNGQKSWMKELTKQRSVAKAPDNKSIAEYSIDGCDCKVRIATGDITRLKEIEVLVNSENDYMQMARIYEKATLSSSLRREGSNIIKGRILDDTVQDELNDQIKYSPEYCKCGRPIVIGQVIPTTAGHRDSALRLNGARYIFHAAIVRVDALTSHENLVPIETDDGLRRAVQSCLRMVSEVDSNNGIVLHQDSSTYKDHVEDVIKYTTEHNGDHRIKSIIFPIFGAGHAGRSAFDVVRPMAVAFKGFLTSNKGNKELALKDIHLCVYAKAEIEFVKQTFEEVFSEDD